mmetsp:Transcript_29154/g.78231  ORF Transcript_29154/g.78231 Transcript_29154/m.78231 type:complete len:300 (-) Transcript_29154:195-1094(-)
MLREGSAKIELARQLARELDQWPGCDQLAWADSLYEKLTTGVLPLEHPPCLLNETKADLPPELAALTADEAGHSLSADTIDAIATKLRSNRHVIVDGFLGVNFASTVRSTLTAAWDDGVLTADEYLGTDHTAWADTAADARWASLAALEAKADELVGGLRRAAPDLAETADSCFSRQHALCCRYSAGASLDRHADNPNGENKRWLTLVYYAQSEWVEADGGCLRLYREESRVSDEGGGGSGNEPDDMTDDPVLDVAPLGDRLVIFFSDLRSPHEVLKANAPRYAITLWYREEDPPLACV